MQLPPELDALPNAVKNRLESLERDVQTIISKATAVLGTEPPWPIAFRYTHGAPGDILTVDERAQSVSFIARYEHLPTDYTVQVVEREGKWFIGNLAFLRHALNDYRPLIQNRSDAVYYRKVHNVWYQNLMRQNAANGLTIRALDTSDNDVTLMFAKYVGERNKAISIVLGELEYEYLYNGILQHSNVKYSERFLEDYVSGELNYVLWKHVQVLMFIREMLRPYHLLMNVLTFPKPGPL